MYFNYITIVNTEASDHFHIDLSHCAVRVIYIINTLSLFTKIRRFNPANS